MIKLVVALRPNPGSIVSDGLKIRTFDGLKFPTP
jgi:hypothetical protein